jgi:hypothetical protein
MKKITVYVVILIAIVISGCGKKNEESNKSALDTLVQAKSDTLARVHPLPGLKVKGFYDTTISFSDYIETHPNLKTQVEFADLINMLAVNKSTDTANHEVTQVWEVLADRNTSPVNWLTSGGGASRTGEIILTFSGKPVETLDTYLTPAIWKLTLTGNKTGVDEAEIECDVLTRKLGHLDIPSLCKKDNINSDMIKSTGDPSTGEQHYQLTFPGKEPMWMIYEWSCGSGGCSAYFTLYYNKDTYDKDSKKPL